MSAGSFRPDLISRVMDEQLKKKLLKLQARCVRREYCASDMRKKALLLCEGNVQEAEELVNLLIQDRFVDDLRYASAFAREKASLGGWGPVKIRFMLSSKGIARPLIDEALKEIDSDRASSKMHQVLSNKWKTLKDDPQGKLKLLRFALSKGYEYDSVSAAVDSLVSDKSD